MLLTVLVAASAAWALWTLASTPPTSGPAIPMTQLARSLAPFTLWSLLVTAPALAVMWRFALRDRSRVLKTRANRTELSQLTPEQFERWCAVRLEAMGYRVRRVAGVGDHGIDLIAERGNAVTVVQCKRNTARRGVGEPQVRDLYGAMHDQGASGALLMSAGSITAAARAWARGKPIELWDVEALAALPSPMPG